MTPDDFPAARISPFGKSARTAAAWLATLLVAAVLPGFARGQINPPPLSPSVDASKFRVTVFAEGLNYPKSMQELSDGSLLVGTSNPTGGSLFNSTGQLIRLVDANGDGHADGPGQVLADNLPGAIQSVRQAGDLLFVDTTQSGSEGITILRQGAAVSDPYTQVGQISMSFPANWEHTTYALATQQVDPSTYNVYFNIGSKFNDAESTDHVTINGLGLNGLQANEASIYRVTVHEQGNSVSASGLTQIAMGLRNAAGMAFQPGTGNLYFEDNGIDSTPDPNEPLSADELNKISAANLGGAVEDFGFVRDYIEYRTGNRIGSGAIQPIVAFQPIPDPKTGSESEGAVEIAFAPSGFPAGLNNGVFLGFHGKFNDAGVVNEENPLVYYDLSTGQYFHFIENTAPQIGHLDGLLATSDSLFAADLASSGTVFSPNGTGVIYQIKAVPEPGAWVLVVIGGVALTCWRRRKA